MHFNRVNAFQAAKISSHSSFPVELKKRTANNNGGKYEECRKPPTDPTHGTQNTAFKETCINGNEYHQ